MSEYRVKPKSRQKKVFVGCDSFEHPDDPLFYLLIVDKDSHKELATRFEGTGRTICRKMEEYCNLDDDLTYRIYHDLLLNLDPQSQVLSEEEDWRYYTESKED